jgi:hypothetical protein
MLAFLPTGWRASSYGAEPPQQPRPTSLRPAQSAGTITARRVDTVQKDGFVLFRHLGVEAQFSPRGLIGERRKPQTPLAPRLPVLGVRTL